MKIHILTIGKPKLDFAKIGLSDYLSRLKHYHQVRVTHLADKYAYDAARIMDASSSGYRVVLEIDGKQLSSPELAKFLKDNELASRELTFIIGGPEGLPIEVRRAADYQLSFGKLTLPHDLAMVVLAETLYRASSINAGSAYHK